MPDLGQIKQEEQGVRDRRGRFARGRSGNPAGRPRGCRYPSTAGSPGVSAADLKDAKALLDQLA